jgi:regulation of enolase protein 1 (concanavalin A-like superfamily)
MNIEHSLSKTYRGRVEMTSPRGANQAGLVVRLDSEHWVKTATGGFISHSHALGYISLVIIHTKQTSCRHETDFTARG